MSKKLLAEKIRIALLVFYLEQSFEFIRNYCNLITKIMPLRVWKWGLYISNSLVDSSRLLGSFLKVNEIVQHIWQLFPLYLTVWNFSL